MLGMSTGLLWGKGLQWAYGVNSEWNKNRYGLEETQACDWAYEEKGSL